MLFSYRIIPFRKLFAAFFCFYVFGTIIVVYKLFLLKNGSASTARIDDEAAATEKFIIDSTTDKLELEIWGKAAISLYLWEHILSGPRPVPEDSLIDIARMTVNHLSFTFRTGPGLVPATAPSNVTYLTLVLNGRSQEKITQAKIWLDSLPAFINLRHTIIFILGDEYCNNDWLLPYMRSRGGLIDACFMTYDCTLVDNIEIFQWPLGVAIYRGFPDVNPTDIKLSSKRPNLCNFLGTIYKNSSRETLATKLEAQKLCLFKPRDVWQASESKMSLNMYISSILASDLTLSPVGQNTECYRLYEALALGSVPVVEDVMTPGKCDATPPSPLRLLKAHSAPFIYLKDWTSLESLLETESRLSHESKVIRRTKILQWYTKFKAAMAEIYFAVIDNKFF